MDHKINSFSKEAIKARMIQNAVKLWGLKSASSIDPFIALLIDAFSMEIYKANNEIRAVNSRVLQQLAKLLTPEIYTYPQPAHAIAFTFPNEAKEVLPKQSEYFTKRQFSSTVKSSSDTQIDIHFTPIDNINLVKMKTFMMVTANTVSIYDDEQNKIPIARTPEQAVARNQIMLGIDASSYKEENLPEVLSLYCSNSAFETVDFVFKLLPFISLKIKQKEMEISSGLTYAKNETKTGFNQIFQDYSVQKRIEENIKNIYKSKFIEISGFDKNNISKELPSALQFIKENKDLIKNVEGRNMIWLEMNFLPQYSIDILENFSFTLNAFPIYNRKWKNNEYALDIMGDNIPLHTSLGEHYLYTEQIIDSHGNIYDEIPFQQNNDSLHKGLYTIRKGGMERFNERNAIDMISNVMEATRDEVSAFGVLERDKVVDTLRGITSQMRELDQKIVNAEKAILHETFYAIINPHNNIEHIRADYWVTHCLMGNNLRRGTTLPQPKFKMIKSVPSIKLLTETTGGNEGQTGAKAIQAYKYALTTRDKLISIEDIKSFCYLSMENSIKSVTVKRGTMISQKPKEGFIRTIEIEIIPESYDYLGSKYWEDQAISLKRQIMLRGIDGLEYVVKIKKDEHKL